MRVKKAIRRLCRSCYVVKRKGRLYVYCKANTRHKQRQKFSTAAWLPGGEGFVTPYVVQPFMPASPAVGTTARVGNVSTVALAGASQSVSALLRGMNGAAASVTEMLLAAMSSVAPRSCR